MINLTTATKAAQASENPMTAKATVYLADETMLNLTEADILADGLRFFGQTQAGSKFVPGGVCMSKIDLTLINLDGRFNGCEFEGAEIVPYVAIRPLPGNNLEWVQLTRYTILDAPEADAEIITLTAYDNIYKMAQTNDGSLSFPVTLGAMAQWACDKCNIVLNTPNFPMADFEVTRAVDIEGMTYQQIMSYIAAISGTYGAVNRQGQFAFGWFGEESQHDIASVFNARVEKSGVNITGVRVKAAGTQQDYGETWMIGEEGYVTEVSDNPFIVEGTAETVARHLADVLIDKPFRPLAVEIMPDLSFEVGDTFMVHLAKGSYKAYLTNFSWTINGVMRLECKAETAPKAKLNTYSGNVGQKIKDRIYTEQQLKKYDVAVQEMNKLAANTMGFYYTQEVQDDGSIIAYWHDKPDKAESTIIYKQGIDGFFLSQDGGKTYTTGRDSQGNAVVNILQAIGISAEWLDVYGKLRVVDEDGNVTLAVNSDGSVEIMAESLNVVIGNIEKLANKNAADLSETNGSIKDLEDSLPDAIESQLGASGIIKGLQDNITLISTDNGTLTLTVTSLDEWVESAKVWIQFLSEGIRVGDPQGFSTLYGADGQYNYLQNVLVSYIKYNRVYNNDLVAQNSVTVQNKDAGRAAKMIVDEIGSFCVIASTAIEG